MKEKIIKAMAEGCLLQRTGKYIKIKAVKGFKYIVSLPKRFVHAVDYYIGTYARKAMSKSLAVQRDKIVFMTYNNEFMCNPKYIAEEIHRQGLPYDLVWICNMREKNAGEKFPSYLRLAERNSYQSYRELMSARIWIDNSLNCIWQPIPKKEGQVYLETWHGSLGLKKAGADDVKNRSWVKRARTAREYVDYCISNSTFEDSVYRETHCPETPILRYGHARNDILFASEEKKEEIRKKVYNYFNIDMDVRLALYAPTFRDSKTFSCYNIQYGKLVQALETRFGGTWKILLRHHFHNRKAGGKFKGNEYLINATSYIDMQELLIAAEVGISDYSSWVCDFVLMKKPVFIYAVDLQEYNNERGLYYPLETTPFSVAVNNSELLNNILEFDNERYTKEAERFVQEKGCVDDGHAAERIVGKIREIIEGIEDSATEIS